MASGALGFVRTWVLAQQFGTTGAYDAFIAAQRIPEIIFQLVAGGALGSSFIPIYASLRREDTQAAWNLASAVMTLTALAAAIAGVLVFALAGPLVDGILLPGRPAELQALAVTLTRIMVVTPAVFAISGLVMGILQSHGLFLLPSLAISMNSIGIIAGAVLLAPLLATAPYTTLSAISEHLPITLRTLSRLPVDQVGASSVYGLAVGAVLSALLHLFVQLPGLVQIRARLRFYAAPNAAGVRRVLVLMAPRVLGLAVVQINFVVNIVLTSNMVEGSLVALNTAFMLMYFALGIIGQSVGSAVFPTLAALSAREDWDGFKERLAATMRTMLFLALPATIVFIVFGEPIVTLFERGEWTAESTQATAWALAFYGSGIAGFALLEVLSRAFYALADTWTPVVIGLAAMVGNIALSLLLVRLIGDPNTLTRGPFAGLALANALTTLVEAGVLWWLMRRRIGPLGAQPGLNDRQVWVGTGRTALACIVLTLVLLIARDTSVLPRGWPMLLGGGAVGAVSFFAAAIALGLTEARAIPQILLRRIRR